MSKMKEKTKHKLEIAGAMLVLLSIICCNTKIVSDGFTPFTFVSIMIMLVLFGALLDIFFENVYGSLICALPLTLISISFEGLIESKRFPTVDNTISYRFIGCQIGYERNWGFFECSNFDGVTRTGQISLTHSHKGAFILSATYDDKKYCGVKKKQVKKEDSLLYQKPVIFIGKQEFGNDYYYYAKLRPDLSLKNFGLNKLSLATDGALSYKNINDSIDSQVHRCADSLQAQAYYNMLDTADAFYFHGEIIPAEQVFAEVPQAREYYEKYCGKAE